jgi:hypothetical protein
MRTVLAAVAVAIAIFSFGQAQTVVVAEGERFTPQDKLGWKLTDQEHSYASQAFGGMWVTHGALLGATAESAGSVAVQQVNIPAAGNYRVWSKYQSPPYFNYLHRIEVWQGGKVVFTHDYGKVDAERMWTFCGGSTYNLPPKKQIWFTWGVDHDAAEAPKQQVTLAQGPAEIRLITLKNVSPGGDRYVDFVVLTTAAEDTCIGWEKNGQAKSPFIYEALRATPIYVRFQNAGAKPAKARLFTHMGHFTWHCGSKQGLIPPEPVAPGAWSPWVNVNEIVELLTDEGLQVTLVDGTTEAGGAASAPPLVPGTSLVNVQVALDSEGKQMLGELAVPNGETINFPIDIVWNRQKKLRLSKDIAAEMVQLAKAGKWRTASPNKPQQIAYYGAFRSDQPWAMALKDALGYNTLLPDGYQTLPVDGYHQHLYSADDIRKFAQDLGAKRTKFRVCSFGDEIAIGGINFDDPQYVEPFRAWLKQRGLTQAELGVAPEAATLTGNARLKWHARQFGAEQRFAHYRELTGVAREAFGPQVLCGANFSPHHDVLYYGDHLQWIDAFKHQAMSMFWTEDYIFFVPELPQTISFMFARMHCATKYHKQPIHMYVMPHQPGQPDSYFRRNTMLSIGAGAKHIDHFWVGPPENFTENYVSWQFPETYQAIYETMHDTAAIEPLLKDATRRPARVAIVTGKATALNEDEAAVDVNADKFLRMCHLAGKPTQNICRKDQQFLYFALRHAQHDVDLITEEDIIDDGLLRNYSVVYFAGEWIDHRTPAKLDEWVQAGGVLVASTGLGMRNQYNEATDGLTKLLGLAGADLAKNFYHVRPLLELPLAEPIDVITLDAVLQSPNESLEARPRAVAAAKINAIAFKQRLTPAGNDVQVLGRWSDGSAAVTMRPHGKGNAFAVGTALGATYLKSGVLPLPWARGGFVNLYNPTEFDRATTSLARIGVDAVDIERQVTCSQPHVESLLLDSAAGSLLTLVNWTNESTLGEMQVSVKLPAAPSEVYSVTQQKKIEATFADGRVTFTTKLGPADYIMLKK